jgi:hypothetical protein
LILIVKFEINDFYDLKLLTVIYLVNPRSYLKMSRKYVPTFLKDNAVANAPVATSTASTTTNAPVTQSRFAGGGVVTSNKFSALSDDFPSINSNKPPTQSAVGAPGAPKPFGTLASITSATAQPTTGKKSYASKFSESTKTNNGYPKPPPPPEPKVDVSSESDFPTLGAPSVIRKNASNSSLASTSSASASSGVAATSAAGATTKYSDFAKSWAQKIKEEEEATAAEAERKRKEKEEYDSLRSMIKIPGFKHKKTDNYVSPDDIEDEDGYNNATDDYLGGDDDDDYHVPSGDEDEGEEEFDEENADEQPADDYWH